LGEGESMLLCKNERHFGVDWSPDSKTLLVYDNYGSGSSDVIVFRLTANGWMRICKTDGGFHVVWRLAKWVPGGVNLHAQAGGSCADVPPGVNISFADKQPKKRAKNS